MDLENDPGEMNNLASLPQYQPVLDRHRGYLMQWITLSKDAAAKAFAVPPSSR